MVTYKDVKKLDALHQLPKNFRCNNGNIFQFDLFDILSTESFCDKHYKYDFDIRLEKYGVNLQRPYVWEHHQQQEFIMDILLEKQIAPCVIVEHIAFDKLTRRQSDIRLRKVIDGKQRLLTIHKFALNEFPIKINGEDVYYKDFDDELKLFFERRVGYLTADIWHSYEYDPRETITDDMLIILFNYYNFSGTPQTEEHKNKLQALLNKK